MESIAKNPQCPTRKLLLEFEAQNRAKGAERPNLSPNYYHAAVEFRRCLHIHCAECSACLMEEVEQERAA